MNCRKIEFCNKHASGIPRPYEIRTFPQKIVLCMCVCCACTVYTIIRMHILPNAGRMQCATWTICYCIQIVRLPRLTFLCKRWHWVDAEVNQIRLQSRNRNECIWPADWLTAWHDNSIRLVTHECDKSPWVYWDCMNSMNCIFNKVHSRAKPTRK